MDSDDVSISTSDTWDCLDNLFKCYSKMKTKVKMLEKQVDIIWNQLHPSFEKQIMVRRSPHQQTLHTLEMVVEEPVEPPSIIVQPPDMEIELQNQSEIANIQSAMATDEGALGISAIRDQIDMNLEPNELQQVIAEQQDFHDLPTQKLETLSQAQKRASDYEKSPKRPRLSGYTSFRESLSQKQKELEEQTNKKQNEIEEQILELDKENVPPPSSQQRASGVRSVSTMLQEAGLADIPRESREGQSLKERVPGAKDSAEAPRPRAPSETSETPLGSLDRTKVSLGDSVTSTDTQRYIRSQWGVEGTMVKVLRLVRAARRVTVRSLLRPAPPKGLGARAAAACFTSLLKLKQHNFITITKNPSTLEIVDVALGQMFSEH